MEDIDRIPSGIPGLDSNMEGGFPKPSIILVLGDPGTGKTTFALQTLFYGASHGENVLYITGISEPVSMIKKNMSRYDFFDKSLIDSGRIQFWDLKNAVETMGPERTVQAIKELVRKTQARRVVIDPLTFFYMFEKEIEYRKYLYEFFKGLRELDVLTILVGEKPPSEATGIEGYMVDGIILFTLENIDNKLVFKNLMRIRKMRGTNHNRDSMSVEINSGGMHVYRFD